MTKERDTHAREAKQTLRGMGMMNADCSGKGISFLDAALCDVIRGFFGGLALCRSADTPPFETESRS
jgi:hypothetical protein